MTLCERCACEIAPPSLTAMQHSVLRLVVQGMTDRDIAATLGKGYGTVKCHARDLRARFGVSNRTQLALAGARYFMAKPETSAEGLPRGIVGIRRHVLEE